MNTEKRHFTTLTSASTHLGIAGAQEGYFTYKGNHYHFNLEEGDYLEIGMIDGEEQIVLNSNNVEMIGKESLGNYLEGELIDFKIHTGPDTSTVEPRNRSERRAQGNYTKAKHEG